MFTKIKTFFSFVRAYFPKTLPQGLSEHNEWAGQVIRLAGVPDNRSTRFVLASAILNSGETACDRPKMYFIRLLRKAAAGEVAAYNFHVIKKQQEEERSAERAALIAQQQKSAEVTAVAPVQSQQVALSVQTSN